MNYPPPPAGLPAALWPAVRRLPWLDRLVVGAAGCVMLTLLVTAACLTPSPQGLGTHQQLGLPPCTLVAWFGIRCPSCGMTTSWAHLLRGHVVSAMQANTGGALLAIAAATCGPWLAASGLVGRWVIGPPRAGLTLAVGLTIVVVTLTQWTLRLSLGW
jgi:Protein of unknown function (DUF2752)